MEDVLCKVRDVYRSIAEFEMQFERKYNLCFNEGMLLCSLLKEEMLSSGEIANLLGLTNSNASKVIKSVEEKGLIERILGDKDKRQMYFRLTHTGKNQITTIKCSSIEIPDLLKSIVEKQ